MELASFRFDAGAHEYVDLRTGAVVPHITGMLKQTGWVDDRWFTEESCARGQAVHRLTADYDLGALDVADVTDSDCGYKGWLQAHVRAMDLIRPVILAVEQAILHPTLGFGGCPDRIVRIDGVRGPLDIKSGGPQKSHRIQLALQAILDSVEARVPAEALGRWALYLRSTGKCRLVPFHQLPGAQGDMAEARTIIRTCCA